MTTPSRPTLSAWVLVAVASLAGAVSLCAGSISDVDLFWHVEVGTYTLHGDGFPFPDPWAYTLPDVHWHSTAWLSELVLAAVYDAAGWAGIVVLRLLLTVGLYGLLGRLVLGVRSAREGWAGPVVLAVTAIPLAGFVQERPQTVSLLFCVWLAARVRDLLLDAKAPRPVTFVAMTWLWAWLHGLFVLAPAMLVLCALAQLLDHGRTALPLARRLALTATTAVAASAATAMGPRLLLAPFTVSSAARGFIAEWQPTPISYHPAWGLYALLGLVLLAWARTTRPVPRSEALVVLVLAVFGLVAIRNCAPASLILVPIVLNRVDLTWRTESTLRLPRRLVVGIGALAMVSAVASYAKYPPLDGTEPSRLAAVLAAQPEPVRVLDDYNLSGFLISRAHGHIKLVVDGRADRYGKAFLDRYEATVVRAEDWQKEIAKLRPDVAVLGKKSALGQLLVSEAGWRLVLVDESFALLAAPGTTLVMP